MKLFIVSILYELWSDDYNVAGMHESQITEQETAQTQLNSIFIINFIHFSR